MDYDFSLMQRSETELRELSWKSSTKKGNGRDNVLQFHFDKDDKIKFPPTSLEEAEDMQLRLLTAILDIESQLGDRDRKDVNGERLWGKDYWDWRKRANDARIAKIKQRAKVKKWIKDQTVGKRELLIEEAANQGLGNLLSNVSELLHKLAAEGVEYDEEEQAIVNALDRYRV
jgi:hypothetical protein